MTTRPRNNTPPSKPTRPPHPLAVSQTNPPRPLVLLLTLITLLSSLGAAAPVELHWLEGPPTAGTGSRFGVPWKRGEVPKNSSFTLTDSSGKSIPLQSWPAAYWPDGSLKWTAHAIGNATGDKFTLSPTAKPQPTEGLTVEDTDQSITIKDNQTTYHLAKTGPDLVQSIDIAGKTVAEHGLLICSLDGTPSDFTSDLKKVTIEQRGPVRAVVKFEGLHKNATRQWLPFVVRLYVTAGCPTVRLVHTIIFDGDQQKDFIHSLGLRFSVPLHDEPHNRHVRLAGDSGLFAEPLQVMLGRRPPPPDLYRDQIAGKKIPPIADLPNGKLVEQMAVWDDFKLTQSSADGWTLQKRTNPQSAWIQATAGHRALGLAFLGDSHAGLAISIKDFWQTYPSGLEINHASADHATLTAWLWSPDAPPMDLRHYDTKAHGLEAAYEDVEPGFSTPTGVARTRELTFRPTASVPSNEDLVALAKSPTPLLVATPAYYHSTGVFGVWSLPDQSTPLKKHLEEQLAKALAFYKNEIDQRRWYGFWDYGDVMHSYDPVRHQWKYDVGGFAWANSELMPDLWLWYSFLRTGRADVFRIAEAMTRHTQEVDVYHLGRFAGLGSRHNVRHWGDGAKELRIAQAPLKRFYYYLTTDERTGDLMTEVIDADKTMATVDPLRKIEPKTQYPTHARIGPDWLAMCGNWMTAWERTGDTQYRDRILTGAQCIASFPHGFFSGDSCGYDPATHQLFLIHPDQIAIPHLAALMGGPEMAMELSTLLEEKQWNVPWLNYCRYLQAPADEQRNALGGAVTNGRGADFSRITAYAARALNDPALAKRAWQQFLGRDGATADHFPLRHIEGPDVPTALDEIPTISTNDTSQWSLNCIELLELIGDKRHEYENTRPNP